MSSTPKVDVVGVGLNATDIFAYFAATARLPQLAINWPPALILSAATLTLLLLCGLTLYRTTRFH